MGRSRLVQPPRIIHTDDHDPTGSVGVSPVRHPPRFAAQPHLTQTHSSSWKPQADHSPIADRRSVTGDRCGSGASIRRAFQACSDVQSGVVLPEPKIRLQTVPSASATAVCWVGVSVMLCPPTISLAAAGTSSMLAETEQVTP